MTWFKIHPNYRFEIDSIGRESCILDIMLDKKRSFNQKETQQITRLLNVKWECIIDDDTRKLAADLIINGIGYLFSGDVYIEKFEVKNDFPVPGLLEPIPFIDQIFIELSNHINKKYVYFEQKNMVNACATCLKWRGSNQRTNKNYIDVLVKKFNGFYIKKITFSGIYTNADFLKMQNIVNRLKAHNGDMEYELLSDGEIKQDVIDYCIEKNIKIVFTAFGVNEENYVRLFGNAKLFVSLKNWMQYLDMKGIRYGIAVVCDSEEIKEILDYTKDVKWKNIIIAEIIDSGNLITLPTYDKRKVNENINYFDNKDHHPCLHRKIAIDCEGNIHPCPEINTILGNIIESDLSDIFCDTNLYKWWKMTKSNIKGCSKCIHRFGCEDCAALEVLGETDPEIAFKICEHMEV